MKTVYIETSIISYLAAQPSRDLLAAAHQQVSRTWWDAYHGRFEVFVSPLVIVESSRGDPHAAKLRLAASSVRYAPDLATSALKFALLKN